MEIEDSISYTLAEASTLLNVSLSQLHIFIKSSRIEVRKTDYAERIRGKELKRFIQNNIPDLTRE